MTVKRLNCDVFFFDGDTYENGGNAIYITGNIWIGEACNINADINTEGDVFVEEDARVWQINAKNIFVGSNSKADKLVAQEDIVLGSNIRTTEIEAGGCFIGKDKIDAWYIKAMEDICLGNDASTCELIAGESVIIENHADVENICAKADVLTGDDLDIDFIEAGGDVMLGDNADTGDIKAGGSVSLGENASTGPIETNVKW